MISTRVLCVHGVSSFMTPANALIVEDALLPKIFEIEGYRFFFYSDEGNPREPVHVHVRKGGQEAKFWVRDPIVVDKQTDGFNGVVTRWLTSVVVENRELIERKWHEHFQ